MLKPHIALASAITFLASSFVFSGEFAPLHVGPLTLTFPSTWHFDVSNTPTEGFGPEGEKALISARTKGANASAPSSIEVTKDFAQGRMAQLAEKRGKLVRPVSELPAPSGKVIYSAATEYSGLFTSQSYFLQYAIASQNTAIYITFEGQGGAEQAMKKFDEIIATQKWGE